jgi:hypothetical protein
MTDAVMFDPTEKKYSSRSNTIQKNILALRGSFRPVTVNMDMYEKSLKMFLQENKVDKDNTLVIFEITCLIYVQTEKSMNVISWIGQNCCVL